MALPHDGAIRLRSLRPRLVLQEGGSPPAAILHSKSGGMADGGAQDPFAGSARPGCSDGGGRVCTSAHPVAGTVEQRLATAEVSALAGPSSDQAGVGGGGGEDGIGRVFWRHVAL
jgi:hypothetical protein